MMVTLRTLPVTLPDTASTHQQSTAKQLSLHGQSHQMLLLLASLLLFVSGDLTIPIYFLNIRHIIWMHLIG